MNCSALSRREGKTYRISYGVILNCATQMIYRRDFHDANYVATCLENVGSAQRTNVESGKNTNNVIMMQ
jgi:hypothetical protein